MNTHCIVSPDVAGPTRNGGVGAHTAALAVFLAGCGTTVTVVHTGPPDDTDRFRWRKYFREMGVALIYLDDLPTLDLDHLAPDSLRHATAHCLHDWLRKQAFDAIHFQDWQGNGAVVAQAKRAGAAYRNTLITVTAHGSGEWIREGMQEFGGGGTNLVDDALERAAVAAADMLICPTRHMREWLRGHGWTLPKRVEIWPYLSPPLTVARGATLAPHQLRELIFFGRLETRKGLLPFLDALDRLAAKREISRLRITFLGKHHTTVRGPSEGLISKAAAEHADRFDFEVHPRLNQSEALQLLQSRPNALIVMPSLADNAPFAVLECLRLGLPLLTSDRGGISEFFADRTHLVAPEACALAHRIAEIFESGLPAPNLAYDAASAEARWSSLLDATQPSAPLPAPSPSVSVVIPHFEQATLLEKTLKALRKQTLAPHEVLVIDDGSATPAAHTTIDRLVRKPDPAAVRVIRQTNLGPAAARNHGARLAIGDALLFVDADNLPHPDMVEKMARALAHSGADIVTCAFRATKEPGSGKTEYIFCPLGAAAPELLVLENVAGDSNFIIRREVFEKLGGFPEHNRSASEDWEFLLRATQAGYSVAVLPEVCYDYRLSPHSHARTQGEFAAALAAQSAADLSDPHLRRRLLLAFRGALAQQSQLDALRATGVHLQQQLTTTQERHALTQQHAANLERLLAAEQQRAALAAQLSAQHVQNLERSLAALEERNRSVEHQAKETADRLARVEQQAQALAHELTRSRQQTLEVERLARQRIDELQTRLAHAESVIRTRDEKISRMTHSASWQLTSPLRALRRLTVDPLARRPTPAPAPAPAAAQSGSPSASGAPPDTAPSSPSPTPVPAPSSPGHHYTYNFDHPRAWRTSSNKLLILGWCFENAGSPIKGIRARFGDDVVPGIYGSKRLDVMASVGGLKQAEYCGVKLELKTTVGEHPLVIEVEHDDGWFAYFETTVRVGEPGDPGERSEYENWCAQHETLTADDRAAIAAHIERMPRRPVISVVMPTYNPPEELLVKALASVRDQLYPHWQLCIADDRSTEPHVRTVLERAAAQDDRIKLTFRPENGHISAASNTALELATGEYVALFDHDDVLHPCALYEVAAELESHPDAEFIYTDEDKIDGEDHRFDPYFKPDWNPDLLHGQNFTSHLSVFRTQRLRDLGGFRRGFEGSQDWDLTLRVIEQIAPGQIRHIPRVLYHWRAVPGSTALQLAEKSYPVDAAKRALLEHFDRLGHSINLLTVPGDHWRIQYPVPSPAPLVSLIIPTRNALHLVRQAVDSVLEKTDYTHYEILIVDNNSDDPATLAWFESLQGDEHIRIVRYPGPFNYSAINNFAVGEARGDVIGLLNNDVEVINAGWMTELVAQACRPGIGAVGAMLYYPTNTVQHAGVVLGLGGVAGHPFKEFPRNDQGQKNRLRLVQNYSAVTGACLFIQKTRFLQVGGLNERELAVAFNDVDLCCKLLAAGYRNVWTPFAELYHHESATRGVEDTPEKKARFQREIDYMMETWGPLLGDDPAYNPNLTLVGEDFSTAYLPRWKKRWQTAAASPPPSSAPAP